MQHNKKRVMKSAMAVLLHPLRISMPVLREAVLGVVNISCLSVHRRNPLGFYPLHFFHERSVMDRNPVGSDDVQGANWCSLLH